MEPDTFEQSLAAVLAEALPGFENLIAADRLTGGASQETWRLSVNTGAGEELLCLRRSAGAVDAGKVTPALEAKLLQAAGAAGIPVPPVLHVLESSDGLGEGFLMGWLEGEALGGRITHSGKFADIRPQLARQCGEILARLHAVDIEATGLDRDLETASPEQLVRATWEQYQGFGTPQPMIDYTARWLLENLPAETEPALVHGDFRNGNLMVSPEAGIIGVLDWELAGIGDPVRDLGWVCTNSWRFGRADLSVGGFGTVDDLLAGYESVSSRRIDRDHLRFWTVFGSFWWSVCCLIMAESYRSGENTSVERPAIGRRASEGQADCVAMLIPGPVELPDPHTAGDQLPRADEMLSAISSFLGEQVASELPGAKGYLARVAANSATIAAREFILGPTYDRGEHARLKQLLGKDEEIGELRWALVHALRGDMPLATPGLAEHLRETVTARLAIDQPGYAVTSGEV